MADNKAAVLARFPAAKLTRDVDGFCWVRDGDSLAALNDARAPTQSPAQAWRSAAELLATDGVGASSHQSFSRSDADGA